MREDNLLIRQAKLGSAQAFCELYKGIYKDLYRFALYVLKNPHDAEDAVSEAVTDAWEQIGKLRREESFRVWVFKILSNKCRRRLQEYVNKMQEIPENLCADGRDTAQDMDVRRAFFALSEEERMVLSLHIFGGYSSREIAQMLGLNDSTVRSKQKRALGKMERELVQ